ncbi:MAG: class B sortase [Clostridia bacterium]|nr:class B sortase [Clostridia bacterium]
MEETGKHKRKKKQIKQNKKLKIAVLGILIFIFAIGIGYIGYYIYNNFKSQNDDVLSNIAVDDKQITETKTERILQLEELKKQNNDIIGWIEIENTLINYPVLQCEDNNFYMTHNYKKEYSAEGSIFLDKDYNWELPSSNLLLYGHNNKNKTMFAELLNYKEESYYKEHPTIRFTTLAEDKTYEIIAVFKSRVYYKSEKDVFRYYYFINAENEEEYNNYINESKKASLYDTGKTATYGDQLLTLSTCEYSQEDGRFVVVAKKVQ